MVFRRFDDSGVFVVLVGFAVVVVIQNKDR
jgi:hypothetical protein